MKQALRLSVSMLLLATAVAGAAGKTYRWTDAQGKVHYGDQPPANATQVIETSPSATAQATPPPAATSTTGLGADECQRRQKQLEGYQNAASITETDALGNHREYSAEERQKLIARTQQAINDGCVKPQTY